MYVFFFIFNLHNWHFQNHPPTLICTLCKLEKLYTKMDHPLYDTNSCKHLFFSHNNETFSNTSCAIQWIYFTSGLFARYWYRYWWLSRMILRSLLASTQFQLNLSFKGGNTQKNFIGSRFLSYIIGVTTNLSLVTMHSDPRPIFTNSFLSFKHDSILQS